MNTIDIDKLDASIANLDYLMNEGVIFTPTELKRLFKLSDSLKQIIKDLEIMPAR